MVDDDTRTVDKTSYFVLIDRLQGCATGKNNYHRDLWKQSVVYIVPTADKLSVVFQQLGAFIKTAKPHHDQRYSRVMHGVWVLLEF